MFTVVVEKVIVAIPVLNPRLPESVATKLAAPAGETWMKFSVKLPPMAGPIRFAGTVVVTTISPKLVPAGVFTGLVVPLKVIVVVPLTLEKFTTLVPLTLNTPVVLKVTGSAFAATAVNARKPTQNNGSKTVLTRVFIYFSFAVRSIKTAPNQQVSTPTFAPAKVRFKSPQSGAFVLRLPSLQNSTAHIDGTRDAFF